VTSLEEAFCDGASEAWIAGYFCFVFTSFARAAESRFGIE